MMQLKQIEISNFKSLVDFSIAFNKFNCIIGLNGAGKSTLLQAIDFMSQLMRGDISSWLKKRNWESKDLHSKLTRVKNISIKAILEMDSNQFIWVADFNVNLLRCTTESISFNDQKLLKLENGKYTMAGESFAMMQEYEGSILSSLREEKISSDLLGIKNFLKHITSLDLLSPQSMRQRSRSDGNELGLSGEYLTSFLNQLAREKKELLRQKLKTCYPNMVDFAIKKSKNGWKWLEMTGEYAEQKITVEAKHLNDGFLRLLAILAQTYSIQDFLLFDEIENGINPELIEFLVDSLIHIDHQILVTTHSPMILNYIEDEEAKKSVQYLYKTKDGKTKAIHFFKIPSVAKKFSVMGAGEIYADTNLSDLHGEIVSLGL